MKFGMIFANVGAFVEPEAAAGLGNLAEEVGLESLWTVEHVLVPTDYAPEYPYSKTGKMPGGEDAPIPDPLIWLTFVAAHTERVRLATGILILPQRNPIVLAKEVATLDVLSHGRVTLGIGVGWLREEFDALGVPFEERGRRTDDHVAALRALWSGASVDFHGEFTSFTGGNSFPQPVQPGGIPIVVGGHTEAAAKRAGRIGDGFFPGKGDPSHLIAVMRATAIEYGRDPDAIEITRGGALDLEGVKKLADEGVDRIAIPPMGFDLATLRENLSRFADDVIAKS